jgi:hypothetical protein
MTLRSPLHLHHLDLRGGEDKVKGEERRRGGVYHSQQQILLNFLLISFSFFFVPHPIPSLSAILICNLLCHVRIYNYLEMEFIQSRANNRMTDLQNHRILFLYNLYKYLAKGGKERRREGR